MASIIIFLISILHSISPTDDITKYLHQQMPKTDTIIDLGEFMQNGK